MELPYLYISKGDVETERLQCEQEGRDLRSVEEDFARVLAADLDEPANRHLAHDLLRKTVTLPLRPDYAFDEPSDLEGIRARRPSDRPALPALALTDGALFDRMHGAWTGRCVGCLLGKPVEGWHRDRIWDYLKTLDRWPLSDYFRYDVTTPELRARHMDAAEWERLCFADRVEAMPEDDDTNYTTTGLAILQRWGPGFTPQNVAQFWLENIPIHHTFTAERAAYRNLCIQVPVPETAVFLNPYREWIGAQIRADFWGYAAAGNPERAAELAWRDACVSHVKNGIYGEMWAAAMIAAAFVASDVRSILLAGLGQIPARCRLADAIESVMEWHEIEVDYDTAVYRVHEIWDEKRGHDWCHTISNAMLVAIGLLWGEGDYARSICRAVQPGFDTDCNGATVGSVLGTAYGRNALPAAWVDVIHDTLQTGVAGYHTVSLTEMARHSIDVMRRVAAGG